MAHTMPGNVRIEVLLSQHPDRWTHVVGFRSFGVATQFAMRLAENAGPGLRGIAVSHHNRGVWRPCWRWTAPRVIREVRP